MKIELVHPAPAADSALGFLNEDLDGYPASDRSMFSAGYGELCRIDLNGTRVLEICGGSGALAAKVAARFPKAEVLSLDLEKAVGPEVEAKLEKLPGLRYVAGDALDLSEYEEESFDLVWGQAALHHLAHNHNKFSRSVLRVLKPGGRIVFVYEPLGHNPLFAAIRAARVSLNGYFDESNLFLTQFEQMQRYGFSRCEVQVFNLIGYPMKAFSKRAKILPAFADRVDSWLFRKIPWLQKYAANCNVIFYK